MSTPKREIPTIFYLAAIVIVLGGVIYSAQIATQFLMAIFIAVIASKPVGYLQRKGLPSGFAVAAVLLLIVLLTSTLGGVLGSSVARFTANLDDYDEKVSAGITSIFHLIRSFGIHISTEGILNTIAPGAIMSLTASLLNGLGSLMGNMAMILLIVAFMLAESSSYGVKLKAILNKPEHSMEGITVAMSQINQYLAIKTVTSFITGLVIGLLLWSIGVDFPFMWGLIAFLMNYIPNIGSIIAAVPAMFMAFINLGPSGIIWTGTIFLAINITIGSVIEPKIMGKGLGISTLVVLLSLIFWGWILGTIGMFLSIPLTLAAKIAFESQESTKWIAILLGTERDAEAIIEERKA
ncbi:MAG: AI-2 transport protein TqsA [Salibacteraceae bacterium]|jgi:AI-2 transport protein TqsA